MSASLRKERHPEGCNFYRLVLVGTEMENKTGKSDNLERLEISRTGKGQGYSHTDNEREKDEEAGIAFERKPRIMRTPPSRGRAHSLPDSGLSQDCWPSDIDVETDKGKREKIVREESTSPRDVTGILSSGSEESEQKTDRPKRKKKERELSFLQTTGKDRDIPELQSKTPNREGASVEANEVQPSDILKSLKMKSQELIMFGKKNQNVHKEVKRLAQELNTLINKAITENKHETGIRMEIEEENERLKEEIRESRTVKKMTTTGCQTDVLATPVTAMREEIDIRAYNINDFEGH